MYRLSPILFLIVLLFFWGCQSHDELSHDHAGEEAHQHEEEGQHEEADDKEHEEDGHVQEAPHNEETPSPKETDYGIIELEPDTFYRILHVSGEIMPAQGEEYLITATHTGLVLFNKNNLLEGTFIKKNQVLLTLSTDELIHDNIEAGYIEAKNNFENAQRDYLRVKELNKDKIISDKAFQDTEAKYLSAKKQFDLVKKNYTERGRQVDTRQEGYIKEIYVNEGEYVNAGAPLIKLTRNKRLVLRADVPQQHFNVLPQVSAATFQTPYNKRIYSTSALNGEVISFGKTTSNNSLFTPLFIEVDNRGNLLAGSYIELYLKTSQKPGSLVIPRSAILEEMGRFYVYREHDGYFDKTFIEQGGTDGEVVEILEGLHFGDHVVTKNPYRIKLASLSSELPAHSHNH